MLNRLIHLWKGRRSKTESHELAGPQVGGPETGHSSGPWASDRDAMPIPPCPFSDEPMDATVYIPEVVGTIRLPGPNDPME